MFFSHWSGSSFTATWLKWEVSLRRASGMPPQHWLPGLHKSLEFSWVSGWSPHKLKPAGPHMACVYTDAPISPSNYFVTKYCLYVSCKLVWSVASTILLHLGIKTSIKKLYKRKQTHQLGKSIICGWWRGGRQALLISWVNAVCWTWKAQPESY